jgi:hypothetical protein
LANPEAERLSAAASQLGEQLQLLLLLLEVLLLLPLAEI